MPRKVEHAVELTPLQERFCELYLLYPAQPGKAYREAGYTAGTKNAASLANKLLEKAKVQERIRELMDERSRVTKVTAERVVLELARVGFSDLRNYMTWGNRGARWMESEALSEEHTPAISEIYETEREMDDGGVYRTKRFKLHDKLGALRELAKHTGVGGPAGQGININVDVRQEQERTKAKDMEQLFSEIDEWREAEAPDDVSPVKGELDG